MIIKAQCPDCGDLDLKPDQIRLTDGPKPAYAFTCHKCGDRVSKSAAGPVTSLLRSGGVVLEHIPEEVWEDHPGAPLTSDDLIDLAGDLARDGVDVVAEAEREVGA